MYGLLLCDLLSWVEVFEGVFGVLRSLLYLGGQLRVADHAATLNKTLLESGQKLGEQEFCFVLTHLFPVLEISSSSVPKICLWEKKLLCDSETFR